VVGEPCDSLSQLGVDGVATLTESSESQKSSRRFTPVPVLARLLACTSVSDRVRTDVQLLVLFTLAETDRGESKILRFGLDAREQPPGELGADNAAELTAGIPDRDGGRDVFEAKSLGARGGKEWGREVLGAKSL